jgi:VWFA-related protein
MRLTLLTLACVALAIAQSIPSDEVRAHTTPYVPPSNVIRTEVRVVEVPVVVRDSHLHTIPNLTRDDFQIEDNGKKQLITSFSVHTFKPQDSSETAASATKTTTPPRPRFLALCFDDLHLIPALLAPVKAAAIRFVKTNLAPNDRVVIVKTSHSESSQFTADVPTLVEQIEKITSPPQAVADDSERCLRIPPHEAFIIAEHKDPGDQLLHAKMAECSACYHNTCPESMITGASKAIWARNRTGTVNALGVIDSVVDGMSKLPGQRIILLTSGGFLSGSLETDMNRLMDKARRAEVLINGLDARGLYLNTSAGMAYDGMGILASGTGGTFFHNNNSMEDGFRDLGMVPETTYLLGFAPPTSPDGSFHKLKVRLADKHSYSVEARLGYTALPPRAEFDSEITASDTITDLPATFTWEQWAGAPAITMIAHLDINRLRFQSYQDRRTQKLTIVAVLLDTQGNFVAGKRSELQLSFKDTTYAQYAKTGFTAALTLPAPPGAYSVRAVAQDAMEKKLAAASTEIKIK